MISVLTSKVARATPESKNGPLSIEPGLIMTGTRPACVAFLGGKVMIAGKVADLPSTKTEIVKLSPDL